jgi:hypothetical protein
MHILAIVAARNEADIIEQTVGDLLDQGIRVHLLDHGSSDGTAAALERHLRSGRLTIEPFSTTRDGDPVSEPFALSAILARKEALAAELDAEWFINHDADEFRESPWSHLNLRQGIALVDELGYNAIDFELFNFPPTHDAYRPGDDVRASFRHYEPGASWDRVQIRCWKRTAARVDLVSSAGHSASFADRRVFPIKFLLRHYPIRSRAHGRRKVYEERLPRFDEDERRRGWHVQYDATSASDDFIRPAADLTLFDPDAVRLRLQLGLVDVASRCDRLERLLAGELRRSSSLLTAARERERQVIDLERHVIDLERRIEDGHARLAEAHARADALDRQRNAEEAHWRRVLGEVYASASWRVTAPLRALGRWLRGRRLQ